jgi:hypothetical protein
LPITLTDDSAIAAAPTMRFDHDQKHFTGRS